MKINKPKMKKLILSFATPLLSLIIFSGCGNNNSEKAPEATTQEKVENTGPVQNTNAFKDIDPAVSTQVQQITQHYIHVKNGMVASNSNEAKAGAKGMLDAIAKIDTLKFTAEQKKAFNSEIDRIKNDAQHIAENDDIQHQRGHLNSLSEGMLYFIKSFGAGMPLYYDFCPMANNSKGGYWLSESEEVKNPYFGDEMLTCGEVKETLK